MLDWMAHASFFKKCIQFVLLMSESIQGKKKGEWSLFGLKNVWFLNGFFSCCFFIIIFFISLKIFSYFSCFFWACSTEFYGDGKILHELRFSRLPLLMTNFTEYVLLLLFTKEMGNSLQRLIRKKFKDGKKLFFFGCVGICWIWPKLFLSCWKVDAWLFYLWKGFRHWGTI